MSEPDVVKEVSTKAGSTVKIEHKRGSGTRDQDKVQVKVHESTQFVSDATDKAVEQATSAMETLRSSSYEGDEGGE